MPNTMKHPELIGSPQSGKASAPDCIVAQHAPHDDLLEAVEVELIKLGEFGLGGALPSAAARSCTRNAGQQVLPPSHEATPTLSSVPVAPGDDQRLPCSLDALPATVSQS